MAFGHFLLGSHKFMVTALGLCMKCLSSFRWNPHSLVGSIERARGLGSVEGVGATRELLRSPMVGENRQLVTDEPVEFGK